MVHWAYTVGPWPPTAGEGGGVSWRPGIGNFQAGWWLSNLLDAPWVILGGVDLLHDVQGFTSTVVSPTDLDNLEEDIW